MPFTLQKSIDNDQNSLIDWYLNNYSIIALNKLNPASWKDYQDLIKTGVKIDYRLYFYEQNKQLIIKEYKSAPKIKEI